MRGHIYMATKPYLRGVGYPHSEQLKKELNEMLLKKQEAKIKEIKPEIELDLYAWEPPLRDEPHEEVRHHPKLWYLIAVLKKTGISLDQVGDNMGLTFLGNVIYQFKLLNPGSCNYVCFLYLFYTIFKRSQQEIGRRKMQYWKSSRKDCRRWHKPEIKPKKVSTNGGEKKY